MDIVYLSIYYFLKILFFTMPKRIINFFLEIVAHLFFLCDAKHKRVALTNLDFAFGDSKTKEEKEKIIKQMYENFAFFAHDFIENQNTTKREVLQKVVFAHEEIMQKALQSKRPIILQTAHYGNWELLSLAIAAQFGKLSIVGRKLDSKAMNKILSTNRTRFDIELIDKKGALRSMLKALKNERLLGVLVDQNTSKSEGIEVEFFGHRALHTNVLGVIAKKMDAVIVPVFIKKTTQEKHIITFCEPLDIKESSIEEITQSQANVTQEVIAQKPDEYFWLHKRFKHFYESAYEK